VDAIIAVHAGEAEISGVLDVASIVSAIKLKFSIELSPAQIQDMDKREMGGMICEALVKYYEGKESSIGGDLLRHMERMVFLQIIDSKWKDHLYAMDKLREGIRLRAYGQRDPLIEYKREAFQMFSEMVASIKEEALEMVFKLQPAREERFRGVFSSVAQEMLHPEVMKFEAPQGESFAEGLPEEQPQAEHKPEKI